MYDTIKFKILLFIRILILILNTILILKNKKMKKIIISLAFFASVIFSVNAQDISRNAIGLRLGDNNGFGTEISYQGELSEYNRIEVDLGYRSQGIKNSKDKNNAFKLSGLYQWVWNIDGSFNWFAGLGGGLGDRSTYGFFVNADGVVGIEYDFDFPLLISLDFRQEIEIKGDYGGSDIALSLRYQF